MAPCRLVDCDRGLCAAGVEQGNYVTEVMVGQFLEISRIAAEVRRVLVLAGLEGRQRGGTRRASRRCSP